VPPTPDDELAVAPPVPPVPEDDALDAAPLDVPPLEEVVDWEPPAPPAPWFVPVPLPHEAVAAPSASVSAVRRNIQ
jgi:hypothetical protein